MAKSIKKEDLDENEVTLPDSVLNPTPRFSNDGDAIKFYEQALTTAAAAKQLTVEELSAKANSYFFGPEESFQILGVIDGLRALKASP